MSLYESDVGVREVVTTDPETVRALDDDVRAMLVDVLADDAMTVAGMCEELDRRGEARAETTVRHHLRVLRDAGLVEIARLEDAGGGTRKYYRSTVRMFSYDLPADAEETLAPARDAVRRELASLLAGLGEDHGDAIRDVTADLQPCEHCETQRYREFVVRDLLDRALTDLAEDGTLADLLDGDE